MKKLEELIEILKELDKVGEESRTEKNSAPDEKEDETSNIVIEFGDLDDAAKFVGVHINNADTGHIGVATSALMSILMDRCKEGEEDRLVLLTLLLADKMRKQHKTVIEEE